MEQLDALEARLVQLEGRGYKAYKEIQGSYGAAHFRLVIDHVQGDPFAEPSRLRVLVPPASARLPEWALATEVRRLAAADFLNRALHERLLSLSSQRGSGRSGEVRILRPGQEVLERTSLRVNAEGEVEARFRVGLPARGRTILGGEAAALLTRDVPRAVEAALLFPALDAGSLRRHLETVEDARALRDQLAARGLVAFVADDAHLPRRSGIDDRPLDFDRAVPFRSPERLRVSLEAPNAGSLTGMGVPAGITLIVGGGFHGKSTLLHAIERGVYDHRPDDGRERVVTVTGAVKVRAEDGRSVAGTDISNFIGELPGGQDTTHFRTANASGSTSQAAAIVEALEVGATCLLLDEDTSATNLLIRDARMQALIPDEREPIIPYIDRARELATGHGVSTVLVLGGSGDYLEVADTVIAMHDFLPEEVTERARRVAAEHPARRRPAARNWQPIAPRVPLPDSLDPSHGSRAVSIRTRTEERILFGSEEVELSAVEQLVEAAQTRAMGQALAWARGRAIDGSRPLAEALEQVMAVLAREGLDAVQRDLTGELAAFRIYELAAFLNRVRTLRTRR
jgi:predicted ABC-class ATPase